MFLQPAAEGVILAPVPLLIGQQAESFRELVHAKSYPVLGLQNPRGGDLALRYPSWEPKTCRTVFCTR